MNQPALEYLKGVNAAAVQLIGQNISPYRVLEIACAGTRPEEYSSEAIAEAFLALFASYKPDMTTYRNLERCLQHYGDRAQSVSAN